MSQEEKKQKKSLAIDKVKAPPKDSPQYDYVGVLLEAQQKDFKVFGEVLGLVLNKATVAEKEMARIAVDTTMIKMRVGNIEQDLKKVSKRTDATFEDVGSMKVQMSEMNDKLDDHTGRLDRIEDKLGIKEMAGGELLMYKLSISFAMF